MWDGKFNGVDVPEGVYMFYAKASLLESGEFERAGSVTIIR